MALGTSDQLGVTIMIKSDSLSQAIVEEVRMVPYDSHWPTQFAVERNRLFALFPGHFAAIEHIGSTAVAGLAAKPVIDLMAGVHAIAEADALLEPLCAHGYETSAEFNATLTDRRWLMRHSEGRRTHHLHLVVFGCENWMRRLQFRNRLRADSALAVRYEHLKQELAVVYRCDREGYTQAKAAFINEVLGSVT
ncbi:MAG: GrpB family protein [Chthoniobacteraceae bacterium]